MIEPLDRSCRDSTLFQFTSKQLRDFIDPSHLLVKIDEQLDFAKLVAPLEEYYCPDFGRPAIHPEVMVRALLICSLYNIAPFRRLCSAISENIAYRWFCFLIIDDPVSDHSSISHFIDLIGRDGFAAIFDDLNDELLRMGLLSPEMYVDSSLVKANVNSHDLSPSGMRTEEFKEQAVQVNGLFVIAETTVDDNGVEREETRYFQKPDGRLPLSPVDTDARWRTSRPGKPSGLHYQENVIVDLGRFHRVQRSNSRLQGRVESSSRSAGAAALATHLAGWGYWLQRRPTAGTIGGRRHHGVHPHSSQTRHQHGGQRRLRPSRRPSDLSPRQYLAQGCIPQTATGLHVRGAAEGLSGLPDQGNLPASWSKATFLQCHHTPLRLFKSPGAEPYRRVSEGAVSTAVHRGRNLRFPGPAGMGEISLARTVEGRLRRQHGRAGAQR